MEQAYLKFDVGRTHYLTAGLIIPRIGIINENHLPTTFNGVNRPFVETYVIPGERGSGVIGINGAAAHLVHPGDLVILISYAQMDDALARRYRPAVVHVDADNRIVDLGNDPAAPPPGAAAPGLVRGDTFARSGGPPVRPA